MHRLHDDVNPSTCLHQAKKGPPLPIGNPLGRIFEEQSSKFRLRIAHKGLDSLSFPAIRGMLFQPARSLRQSPAPGYSYPREISQRIKGNSRLP